MVRRASKGSSLVTYLILLFVVIIHVYVSAIPRKEADMIYQLWALYPSRLFRGLGLEGLATYMFLHGDWLHLVVNVIALLGAGVIVEREIGSKRYALVFFFSGVTAGFAHSVLNASSGIPVVGASGAIFGVIAVLFLLMPFKITFALGLPLPAVVMGVIMLAVEFSSLLFSKSSGIAHTAHVAGFIFGCACAFAIDTRRALKGLVIALLVSTLLYFLGVYFRLL